VKIKVFHVITRMIIGGAQENTLYTVEGLHRSGDFSVTLVTGPAVGREGDLLDRAADGGIDVRVLPLMRRALNPVKDIAVFFQLLRMFLRERPHIVHTHSSKAGILGRLAARLAGVKVVIHTIHGLPFHPYQNAALNSLYVFLEKICTRISDKIIVVADAMRDQCLARGIGSPGKYVRIFSGMEVDRFLAAGKHRRALRENLGFADSDFVVAKVARLFPLKGHRDVIEAASRLRASCPSLRFLFIGDGILRESLRARIRDSGLEDRFTFAGLVPPSEVPAYLGAADAVVHASYREGLARVIPQALLAGKPVLSYDCDGAPEVIRDGVNGRLVPVGDVEALAEAVADVYRRHGEYAARVQRMRKRLAEAFSVEKMVKDIRFCYLTFAEKMV